MVTCGGVRVAISVLVDGPRAALLADGPAPDAAGCGRCPPARRGYAKSPHNSNLPSPAATALRDGPPPARQSPTAHGQPARPIPTGRLDPAGWSRRLPPPPDSVPRYDVAAL